MKRNCATEFMEPSLLLLTFFKRAIHTKETEGKLRTAANYLSTKRKAEAFITAQTGQNPPFVTLSEWIERWVAYLTDLHPGHPETVDFYLRNARAMYHLAFKGFKNRKRYVQHPFEGIRIKKTPPVKRALPEQEVKKLLDPRLRESLKSSMRETLDVLLFTLFAQGMVFQDIYNLRWDLVDGEGRIRYWRSKTGTPIEVGTMAEAREIMECYRRADSPFVFPFLHEGKLNGTEHISEQSALRRVNHHALTIGKQAGISIPLTTYVLRHTWATLMLESGKSIELISQCLGHSNIRTTQIYLSRISATKVDSEVEDMFNRMLRPNFSDTPKEEIPQPKTSRNTDSGKKRKKFLPETEGVDADASYGLRGKLEQGRENSPFLNKKEKLWLSSFFLMLFDATKVYNSVIWAKLHTTYFRNQNTLSAPE